MLNQQNFFNFIKKKTIKEIEFILIFLILKSVSVYYMYIIHI